MKKRIFLALIAVMLISTLSLGVFALQKYTPDVTAKGVTAKGSLYGYRVEDYIRIAFSTTYASGSVDYYVDASTMLYAKGTHPGSASGVARDGVSAQSGQQVLSKADNITSIGSEHSATVYAATITPIIIEGLSMNVNEIN